MRHRDDSRGATLLKLKSEMLSYHKILKRILVLFGSVLHIKSKSIERALQRHIIRAISTRNEGAMSVSKSMRRLIAGRSPRIGERAQNWRTTAQSSVWTDLQPVDRPDLANDRPIRAHLEFWANFGFLAYFSMGFELFRFYQGFILFVFVLVL